MERRLGIRAIAVLAAMIIGLATARAESAPDGTAAVPAWAGPLAKVLDTPDSLSADEQKECQERVLDALDKAFGLNLDTSDIAPVRAPSWPEEKYGFLHGGGYNLRIVVSGLSESEAQKIRQGRYEGDQDGHKDSFVGSLHVVGSVSGVNMFFDTVDPASGDSSFDFTAHIDSAYAGTPWGLIDHFFVDVLGADTRDPCPASGDW